MNETVTARCELFLVIQRLCGTVPQAVMIMVRVIRVDEETGPGDPEIQSQEACLPAPRSSERNQ